MNGNQIEQVFDLIDRTMQTSSDEAAEYIQQHRQSIALALVQTGSATIQTSSGPLSLSVADLDAVAA